MKLLPWQSEALEWYKGHPENDFVLVAGTGCGKTVAGANLALHAFGTHRGPRKPLIVVFCPYRSIKSGWASAFTRLGLFVATKPEEIAEDRQVIVSTYAGAATLMRSVVDLIAKRDLIFVFDEFHHLEENNQWASTFVSGAYKPVKRIFLSGTPWRESGSFGADLVPYDERTGEVKADYSHPYGENVCLSPENGKNTVAVRIERMAMEVEVDRANEFGEYIRTDKIHTDNTRQSDSIAPFVRFDNIVDLVKRPIITAMIDKGVKTLDAMRGCGAMPRAGGIVFVSGKKEGEAVRVYLKEKHGKDALFVVSDDPKSHDEIEAFRNSSDEWIIAIDMIAEGTDIPRLNVAVDLSFKLTLLHIIQRWGRVLRLLRKKDGSLDKNTEAVIIVVDHARLRYVAEKIEEEIRKHKSDREDGGEGEPPPKMLTSFVSETGKELDPIFRGRTIEETRHDLALWLVEHNYGGKFSELGYQTALAMAEVFLSTETVPEEFYQIDDVSDSASYEPTSQDIFDAAVERYKSATGRIANEFFGGDYSAANNAINRRMGVQSFSKKNASLTSVKAREAAALSVERQLRQELTPHD